MIMITGRAAIDFAERNGLSLSKYCDPLEDARDGLSVEEAREVAAEDPGLIYIDLACIGWGIVGEPQDGVIVRGPSGASIDVTGYNEGDYWTTESKFLGPDIYGIVPVYETAAGEQFPADARRYPYLARIRTMIDDAIGRV